MRKIGGQSDTDPAGQGIIREIGHDIVVQAQHLTGIRPECHAFVRQHQLAPFGHNELCLKQFFQPADLQTDGWLRAPQGLCRPCKTAQINDRHEATQQIGRNIFRHGRTISKIYDIIHYINFKNQYPQLRLSTNFGSFGVNRVEFNQMFKSVGPVVTPVIHVTDIEQTRANLDVVRDKACAGAFLINHDFPMNDLIPILRDVRDSHPDMWIGVNFLAQTGAVAFPVLGQLAREGIRIDAYWADDARIEERNNDQSEAESIARIRRESGWTGFYTGGVAFKKQRDVAPDHYAIAAERAVPFMDAVCTSGVATGHEADLGKIATFRAAIGDAPMSLASGITPDNAHHYCADVDMFLVATGINHKGDFYNIDPARLDALLSVTRSFGDPA